MLLGDCCSPHFNKDVLARCSPNTCRKIVVIEMSDEVCSELSWSKALGFHQIVSLCVPSLMRINGPGGR